MLFVNAVLMMLMMLMKENNNILELNVAPKKNIYIDAYVLKMYSVDV